MRALRRRRLIRNAAVPADRQEHQRNPRGGHRAAAGSAGLHGDPSGSQCRADLHRPRVCCVIGSKTGRIQLAPSPRTKQAAARMPMPIRIETAASCADAAASLRGSARNGMPNAFTKHAAASAAVNASREPAIGNISRVRLSVVPKPARSAWYVSHSLTKPFSGGRPEMATAPIRKKNAVAGMRRIRPPISSMLRVCVECTTDPAARNSRPLNMAWLNVW